MSDLEAASQLLRSLADARNGPIYELFARLPHEAHGRIGMRISPTAGSELAVHAVVGVTATRPDGREVSWSVALDVDPLAAEVSCAVEVEQEDGSFNTVFEESRQSQTARQAAALVHNMAHRLAAAGPSSLE